MGRNGDSEISGVQKAAILLIALGPEKSSQIFKHLKEDEIEELTLEIANTKSITTQTKDEVIKEFYEICLAQQYIAEGGIGYAKELLENALGADKAMEVIGRLTASLQVKPFEFVRKADASQLLNFIQDEHPQTIALILICRRDRQHRSFPHCHRTDRQMWQCVSRQWTEQARMSSKR